MSREYTMSKPEATADQAIGRPQEWREDRYQEPGKPVDQSVTTPTGTQAEPTKVVSTPVTRKDYESLDKPAERK